MRFARARSFTLLARISTMRCPYVLPSRTIAPVVSELSTSFVAVPAFSRVEPVTTSGPTTGTMARSTAAVRSADDVQARPIV
jgi:hypothetical protein